MLRINDVGMVTVSRRQYCQWDTWRLRRGKEPEFVGRYRVESNKQLSRTACAKYAAHGGADDRDAMPATHRHWHVTYCQRRHPKTWRVLRRAPPMNMMQATEYAQGTVAEAQRLVAAGQAAQAKRRMREALATLRLVLDATEYTIRWAPQREYLERTVAGFAKALGSATDV